MIASDELARWLADPARQRQSRKPADTLARRWCASAAIGDLAASLARPGGRRAAAMVTAARHFMHRTDEIEALIAELIGLVDADPFFRPPFTTSVSDVNRGIVLHNDPDLTISLGVIGIDALAAKKIDAAGTGSVAFTGITTLYRFLKAGDATLSFWEASPIGADFSGERGGRCRPAGTRRIADGEMLLLDGRRRTFVIEHATSDVVLLQAAIHADPAPLAAEFDRGSLAYLGGSATDETGSRIQLMASLLRLMDRADAAPLIIELIEGADHFHARWQMMRELLALDADAALPMLRRMARSDPHVEVRAAAGQTLALFFADGDEAEESRSCLA